MFRGAGTCCPPGGTEWGRRHQPIARIVDRIDFVKANL